MCSDEKIICSYLGFRWLVWFHKIHCKEQVIFTVWNTNGDNKLMCLNCVNISEVHKIVECRRQCCATNCSNAILTLYSGLLFSEPSSISTAGSDTVTFLKLQVRLGTLTVPSESDLGFKLPSVAMVLMMSGLVGTGCSPSGTENPVPDCVAAVAEFFSVVTDCVAAVTIGVASVTDCVATVTDCLSVVTDFVAVSTNDVATIPDWVAVATASGAATSSPRKHGRCVLSFQLSLHDIAATLCDSHNKRKLPIHVYATVNMEDYFNQIMQSCYLHEHIATLRNRPFGQSHNAANIYR